MDGFLFAVTSVVEEARVGWAVVTGISRRGVHIILIEDEFVFYLLTLVGGCDARSGRG